jgi:hypothetical protein
MGDWAFTEAMCEDPNQMARGVQAFTADCSQQQTMTGRRGDGPEQWRAYCRVSQTSNGPRDLGTPWAVLVLYTRYAVT